MWSIYVSSTKTGVFLHNFCSCLLYHEGFLKVIVDTSDNWNVQCGSEVINDLDEQLFSMNFLPSVDLYLWAKG